MTPDDIGTEKRVEVRFWPGPWRKGFVQGPPATREEILMTLQDLQHVLIRWHSGLFSPFFLSMNKFHAPKSDKIIFYGQCCSLSWSMIAHSSWNCGQGKVKKCEFIVSGPNLQLFLSMCPLLACKWPRPRSGTTASGSPTLSSNASAPRATRACLARYWIQALSNFSLFRELDCQS